MVRANKCTAIILLAIIFRGSDMTCRISGKSIPYKYSSAHLDKGMVKIHLSTGISEALFNIKQVIP